MDLLMHFSTVRSVPTSSLRTPLRRRFLPVRCCLPFSTDKAKYHVELEAAINVVERACRLCVDVQKTLLSSDGRIIEKNDNTPVTIADFGVQALVSLELGKLFPSIPLVAEEDSGFIQSNNLVGSVVSVVTDKARVEDKPLTDADVLEAIDRGGKNAIIYGNKPATYWILDPIDGTRGFVRGKEALYVVGLALVVDGEIVLGVMGCPNWQENMDGDPPSRSGLIMVAHVGCGTWRKLLTEATDCWTRCFVDACQLVPKARFCIPDSQTWESLPLSALFGASLNADSVNENEILLLPTCCGSLCKYMMVASGRASVFILRAKTQTLIKVWDHAVGLICVHEAGGKVTDWNERQLDFAADKVERRIIFPSGGVLVSNGNIHDQILKMISSSSSII